VTEGLGERARSVADASGLADTGMFFSRLRDASITAGAAIIASVLTLVGAYTTGWFSYASKDEELRVQLVQMAVGILKEPKASGEAQPRNWAIDVMELNTGVKMNDEERKLLVDLGGLKAAPVRYSVRVGDISFVGECQNGTRLVSRFDQNLQPSTVQREPC
jgi:hypothetical protein